ncbi:hypothetical protein THASP1DRAFT_33817 [Thamnocephalis sphaerospora]|uniref:Uncharacterized protein n=1 Tax=Thamnocephalis sphaerospora TaxID=78915 RepID=A0A4V1IVK9_9FUNG|nr:hypothetical protein THASP1DRAFT_33817 [Thamnocephalis sphaerospora]|eukprot:RKP04419.1 hypothetical protein THASP1DRAFT_33817 [Thamnocephalis sphaerospora]
MASTSRLMTFKRFSGNLITFSPRFAVVQPEGTEAENVVNERGQITGIDFFNKNGEAIVTATIKRFPGWDRPQYVNVKAAPSPGNPSGHSINVELEYDDDTMELKYYHLVSPEGTAMATVGKSATGVNNLHIELPMRGSDIVLESTTPWNFVATNPVHAADAANI